MFINTKKDIVDEALVWSFEGPVLDGAIVRNTKYLGGKVWSGDAISFDGDKNYSEHITFLEGQAIFNVKQLGCLLDQISADLEEKGFAQVYGVGSPVMVSSRFFRGKTLSHEMCGEVYAILNHQSKQDIYEIAVGSKNGKVKFINAFKAQLRPPTQNELKDYNFNIFESGLQGEFISLKQNKKNRKCRLCRIFSRFIKRYIYRKE